MPSMNQEHTLRSKNLVGFRVGDVQYAIDIYQVREIIKPLRMLPLPYMPPSVIGVADHRGEVVPVIDLRLRFGLEAETKGRDIRWIVVKRGERFAGLVVDKVTEVFGAGESIKREVPEIGMGDESRGISSVYSYQGSLIFVVDIERITKVAEEIDVGIVERLIEEQEEK